MLLADTDLATMNIGTKFGKFDTCHLVSYTYFVYTFVELCNLPFDILNIILDQL